MSRVRLYHEIEYLGHVGRRPQFRTTIRQRPIAHLSDGWYVRNEDSWIDSGVPSRPHLVTRSSMIVSVGNAGTRRIHPTRELDRYLEIGAPYTKIGGAWTQINLGTPARTGNLLTWTCPQADVYLRMGGHFLKFGVLLKDGWVPEDNKIAWPVAATGLNRAGALIKRDGVPVARLSPAHVEDLDNPNDARPVTMQFQRIQGTWYAVMTLPDLAGMSKPLLDPTLELQPDATAGIDTLIHGLAPTNNFGVFTSLIVGHTGGVSAKIRTLIKFDLSSLPGNAVISSATFSMYALVDASDNARTFRVFRQRRAWLEGTRSNIDDNPATGATWVRYDLTNNWSSQGGFGAADCEQTDIGNRDFTATEALNVFKDFPLTPTTKTGLDLGNGWLVKADVESDDRYDFASSDHATAANRPKLVIVYTAGDTSAKMKHFVG